MTSMRGTGKPKTMIPKGVATFLPEGTARRRAIEKKILSVFSQWGYQEVITPIFEYLDVFSLGVGEELLNRAYKFVDRATGRLMVLRPDVTPQIARIAATLLNDEPLPIRLCYSANVFRHEEEHAGREREILQIGGELIGLSDPEADAEMIGLAIETLQMLGLKSFKVALGQMAFTRGVLRSFEPNPALFRQVLASVAKKEASHLEDLLKEERVGSKSRKQVLSLLNLFGGEEVFKAALPLADHPSCKVGLRRLKEIYTILKKTGYEEHLLIDLAEVRGFDYYTGTIFEIFAEGVGSELGGGGRYDHLLEKFGHAAPSTGFALHIERIQRALEKVANAGSDYSAADFLILHTEKATTQAIALSRRLRERGFRVIRKNGLTETKAGARDLVGSHLEDARRQKIGQILVMTADPSKKAVQSIDVRTGTPRIQDRKEILECLPPRQFS